MSFPTIVKGAPETTDFRLFYNGPDGSPASPWHDIPIYPDPSNKQVVNFVNEIPRGTSAKMEIATDEPLNPIKQDIKKGALRFYKYGPSLINYGAVPQTFEDPSTIHPELKVGGDGDPIDLLDIGSAVAPFGAVYPAKVLGCLGLLDEGEVDWKIIAIATSDPMAADLNDIADVERLVPGKVDEIRTWFRMYKTAEGKGENEYGYKGEAKDAAFAMKCIEETHESWVALKSGQLANKDELWLA
jgi:inorganic pyrophosphatase